MDTEQLRKTMRAWSSGVTVVTAAHEGNQHGMTVSSFTSVALDPPRVVVSLQTDSRTHTLIAETGSFAVTILAAGQDEISDRFAGRVPDTEDRLAGLETETMVTGAPFLKGGLAYIDCRVIQAIPAGTNTLFLAEVVAASGWKGQGKPLIYHDRHYHSLME